MIYLRSLSIFFVCSSATIAGDSKSSIAPVGNWEFSLSAGSAWRHPGTFAFSGGSRSAGIEIPSFVGNNALITPPIGSESDYADRFYDDGFVRADSSTEIDGLTGYWGYQNSSQVNVADDQISFHATGFQSIRSDSELIGTSPFSHERERGIAPIIQFDARYKQEIAGVQPGLSASLSWMPVSFNQNWNDFSFSQTRADFRHDWTDTYNLGGFAALVPAAPYSGTFEGPGFLLENLPDSRELVVVPIASDTVTLSNTIRTEFQADHTTLSLGPTIAHSVATDWTLQTGIGLSLHWLHWSVKQHEQLTVTQEGSSMVLTEWNDSSAGNKILTGIYFQLAAEWAPANRPWSVKALLRTDTGEKFSKTFGPSRITYDPDGLTAAVMLRHSL